MNKRLISVLLISVLGFFVFLALIAGPASAEQKGTTHFDAGVFAYENGDYGLAAEKIARALELDPQNALYNYYLAKTFIKTDNFQRAAVHLDAARTSGHSFPGLDVDWAFVNYKLNNYDTAAYLFLKLADKDPANALVRYYAGMALLKQEKYEAAENHLEVAAGMDTDLRYNSAYHAGVCCFKTKRLDAARKWFTSVNTDAPDRQLRSAAQIQLSEIKKRKQEDNKTTLSVSLGCEYNENALLEPVDEDDLYAEEEDYIITASLAAGYDIIKTPALIVGATYSHFQMWYNDNDEYDLTGSIADLHARYRTGNVTVGLTYKPAYYWLDSESYLARHTVEPAILWEKDSLQTELSCRYKRNNYLYNSNEDGFTTDGMLRVAYLLPDNQGVCRIGAGYEKNFADHDDYDWDSINIELGLRINGPFGITYGASGVCRMRDYDNINSFYFIERDDTKYIGTAFAEKFIYRDILSAALVYEYRQNDSNIDFYEYQSNAVKFILTAQL